jgi:hypothetical protein
LYEAVWKISGSIYTLYRISGDYGWGLIYLNIQHAAANHQTRILVLGFLELSKWFPPQPECSLLVFPPSLHAPVYIHNRTGRFFRFTNNV